MKSKMNLIVTVFAILIFCVVNTSYAQTSETRLKSNNEWSIISNPRNPYDEVGLKHNQFLVEFFKSEEFRSFNEPKDKNVNATRESENKNVLTAVERFINRFCKKQINICSGPGPYDPFPNDFGGQLRIIQEEKDPMKTLSRSGASRSVMAYAVEIDSLLEKLPKDKEFTRSTFNDFFDLEKRATDDKKLTEDDRKKVLVMTATARYSAYYWRREFTRATSLIPPGKVLGRAAMWDIVGCLVGGPLFGMGVSIISLL